MPKPIDQLDPLELQMELKRLEAERAKGYLSPEDRQQFEMMQAMNQMKKEKFSKVFNSIPREAPVVPQSDEFHDVGNFQRARESIQPNEPDYRSLPSAQSIRQEDNAFNRLKSEFEEVPAPVVKPQFPNLRKRLGR